MKIYLLSKNKNYLKYWSESVEGSKIILEDEVEKLQSNDLLILDFSLLQKLNNINAKVMLLDNNPNFTTCMKMLDRGIKAYGNVYMHTSHIFSAIETLRESKIWIYPDFIAEMISSSKHKKQDDKSIETKTDSLTKREKEIAKLILDGLTNKEIAIKLEISANTIKIHTAHIYKKLHVNDRLSLFAYLKI